jgi:DNA-binding NtrC family response regulator
LRNAVERTLVLSAPGALEVDHLLAPATRMPESSGALPFPATIRMITRAAVDAMLGLVDGNKSEAARRLGISRPRLQRILDGDSDEG